MASLVIGLALLLLAMVWLTMGAGPPQPALAPSPLEAALSGLGASLERSGGPTARVTLLAGTPVVYQRVRVDPQAWVSRALAHIPLDPAHEALLAPHAALVSRLLGTPESVRLEVLPGGARLELELDPERLLARLPAGGDPTERLAVHLRELQSALDDLARATAPRPRVFVRREGEAPSEAAPGERCPWCHDALRDGDSQWACARCGTRHHAACRDEAGGCTVLGCGRRDRDEARQRT